jgi:hypothetical protein
MFTVWDPPGHAEVLHRRAGGGFAEIVEFGDEQYLAARLVGENVDLDERGAVAPSDMEMFLALHCTRSRLAGFSMAGGSHDLASRRAELFEENAGGVPEEEFPVPDVRGDRTQHWRWANRMKTVEAVAQTAVAGT